MLAVTLKSPIQAAFGVDGYAQVRQAIDSYMQGQGGRTLALDDSSDTALINIPPALAADAGSLLIAVRSAVSANVGTDSLLIFGNDDVIPFFQMSNPVTDRAVDQDNSIASDNPYGSNADTLTQYLAPPLPVGRIPLSLSGGAQDALDWLAAVSEFRSARPARNGSVVITNADWSSFSEAASAPLPGPVDFHLSPGYQLTDPSDLQRKFAYVNLHGLPGDPVWKGFDSVQGQFSPVVSPSALHSLTLSGSVVFAENCYGAQIAGRTAQDSCALALARQGAAFIGASGLSFGSYLAPRMFLQDADALAASFFNECATGATIGSALAKARANYLSNSTIAVTDVYKRKTLLQFQLFGDPTWN